MVKRRAMVEVNGGKWAHTNVNRHTQSLTRVHASTEKREEGKKKSIHLHSPHKPQREAASTT